VTVVDCVTRATRSVPKRKFRAFVVSVYMSRRLDPSPYKGLNSKFSIPKTLSLPPGAAAYIEVALANVQTLAAHPCLLRTCGGLSSVHATAELTYRPSVFVVKLKVVPAGRAPFGWLGYL
jgi:hypothetical protein